MARAAAFLALVFVCFAGQAKAQALPATGIRLAMEDQFGKLHDVGDHRGDVLVLVYTDKPGAEAGKVLGEKLHIYFHPSAKGQPPEIAQKAPVKPLTDWPMTVKTPDATIVAVACIGEVPGLMKGLVRSKFKSASPVVPIWLDMTDVMRKSFTVAPGVPNVVVFDKAGGVAFRFAGNVDDNQFLQLAQTIDQLRAKR